MKLGSCAGFSTFFGAVFFRPFALRLSALSRGADWGAGVSGMIGFTVGRSARGAGARFSSIAAGVSGSPIIW